MSPGNLTQVLSDLNNNTLKNKNFTIGFNSSEDAAAFELDNGKILIQSVDFFTPIVDNPFEFGQIAAANSLSDIYAMGGNPLFALNVAGFPEDDLPIEILSEIFKGGMSIAKEAGIPILGGHTVKDKELKFGMAVTGEVEKQNLTRNNSAQPGDILVLTKPIGTGIIATAIKRGKAPPHLITKATNIMKTLNKSCVDIMNNVGVSACTDITGYGLTGHLLEVCRGSNVSAKIHFSKIPFIEGVFELAMENIIPGGTKRNLDYIKEKVHFSDNITETQQLMLADAQTSGGLLISVNAKKSEKLIKALVMEKTQTAAAIGTITKLQKKHIYIE